MSVPVKVRKVCISDDSPVPLKMELGADCSERPMADLFHISLERYFRQYEDIPDGFLQTLQDEAKIITVHDLADTMNLDGEGCKRHIMFVGPPGIGKSMVARALIRNAANRENALERKWFFTLDLRRFAGDEVLFVPHFLFRRHTVRVKSHQPDDDCDEYVFALSYSESPLLHFFLDGLDAVRCRFEDTVQEIGLSSYAPVSTIVYNLLTGKIMPQCKIISTCREFRLRYFPKRIRPQILINVGELSDPSVRTLMLIVCGAKLSKQYYTSWKNRSTELHLLNRTVNNLVCNLMSTKCSKSDTLPTTTPMVVFKLVTSVMNPANPNSLSEHSLTILRKMMRIAYIGNLTSKRIYRNEELLLEANLSQTEVESISSCIIDQRPFAIMRAWEDGCSGFIDSLISEFLCALYVTDMPISGYQSFLDDKLHTDSFHAVRQMLCAIMFDPFMSKAVKKVRLIRGRADDMPLRREMLQKSMTAQFHKVKRWDMLEFFRAIRDCQDSTGRLGFLPKVIDVIDLSHIQLLAIDMQAIGRALANVNVGCLDLSNCDISHDGMEALSAGLRAGKTKIHTLKMDWNTNWFRNSIGVKALRKMIDICEIKDLSWSHCNIDEKLLLCINLFMGDVEIETLRFKHNGSYSYKGYGYLGEFIAKRNVKDLYIVGGNMTKEEIEQLGIGEGQMMLALPDGRQLDTEASDFMIQS